MELVIAGELEIVGSHGMQAHQYAGMLQMIDDGRLNPGQLIGGTVDLESALESFAVDAEFAGPGVTVVCISDAN